MQVSSRSSLLKLPVAPTMSVDLAARVDRLEATQTLHGQLLLAHEVRLLQLGQQVELDFVVTSETVKQDVAAALGNGDPKGKGLCGFKAVVERLFADGCRGCTRLNEMSNGTLKNCVLRFKGLHDSPLPGKPFKFTLAVSTSADMDFRAAIADLAAEGGSTTIMVRRPLTRLGPMAQRVEEQVYPGRAQERKGKAKGRGKGKDKGNDKGNGKDQGGTVSTNPQGGVHQQGGAGGSAVAPAVTASVPMETSVAPPVMAPPANAMPDQSSGRADAARGIEPPEGTYRARSRSPSGPREDVRLPQSNA